MVTRPHTATSPAVLRALTLVKLSGYLCPGARYVTVFLVAWSTSSGVSNTVVFTRTAPLALTASEAAVALTLSGTSTIT